MKMVFLRKRWLVEVTMMGKVTAVRMLRIEQLNPRMKLRLSFQFLI